MGILFQIRAGRRGDEDARKDDLRVAAPYRRYGTGIGLHFPMHTFLSSFRKTSP